MSKIKITFVLISLFSSMCVFSQKNFTLYNMKSTPQAISVNPSFMPKAKLYISLPIGMVDFGVTNSAFSFNTLFKKRADDSLAIDAKGVIEGLKPLNYFSVETNNELFGLGIKFKGLYLSFNTTLKSRFNFVYPKDLIQFAFEGNGKNFLDKRVSLDGLSINLNTYVEYAFGATKEINDKLTVGGRLKIISGLANISTKKTELGIYTDPTTFALTIDGSAEINSSNSLFFALDTNNSATSNNFPNTVKSSLFKFVNKGVGIDLGGTYKLNDKLAVNASIIDLGSISWKSNVSNLKTNDINYTFDGIDLNQFLNDTTAKPLGRLTDTLVKVFDYEQNTTKYSTSLNTKIYLGANYNFTKSVNAGALLFNEFIGGKYRAGFSLSMNTMLKRWLVASMSYTMYNGSFSNIGLGLSMNAGPVQFYILSDNVLSFINPLNARNAHLCGGISIAIKGRNKKAGEKATETEIKVQ